MRDYSFQEKWGNLLKPETVELLTVIHEFKGRQSLIVEIYADALEELKECAKFQSLKSSNRMKKNYIADERLKKLAQDKTIPRNSEEQAVAGYRDVLKSIQENYDYVPVKAGVIEQFYKDLYKYQGLDNSGCQNENNAAVDIETLCKAYEKAFGRMDALILSAMFILDFLCLQPFDDKDVRISWLLISLLLYKSGYMVGKYVSIEEKIENTKDAYTKAVHESSQNWHENRNNYAPFVNYLLGVIAEAYDDFFLKAELLIKAEGTKGNRIEKVVKEKADIITKAEIMSLCPDISQITVQRTLIDLQKADKIKKIGGGRYTKYRWNYEREGD